MPIGTTQKIRERKQLVLKLLAGGCKPTSQIVKSLGLTYTEAYYVLEMLTNERLIRKSVFGKTAVWCLNNEDFKRTVSELLQEIVRIVENNKLKYVYPMRIYRLILKDRKAYELLSRFAPVGSSVSVTLAFINALLEMLYGKPYFVGEKVVYLTTLAVNGQSPHNVTQTVISKRQK